MLLLAKVAERDVERAFMDRLQETLESGRGFAFVGRQVHFDVYGSDYYADLVLFNVEQFRWDCCSDIDARLVAYAYCNPVFPDKAIRQGLINAPELRVFDTFVSRRPADLTEWIHSLPPRGEGEG